MQLALQSAQAASFAAAYVKERPNPALHYNRGKVYIRAVLTHAEYDTGAWKE